MSKIVVLVILFFGFVGLSCSPSHPKKDPKVFEQRKSEGYNIDVKFTPEVDILFVVDDSGSMKNYQNNLSKNISAFVDQIGKNQLIDYHIGVTVSDWESDLARRGMRGQGRLEGFPPFVDKSTPDGLARLVERVVAGIDGHGWERFFDPVISAITPPLMGANLPNGEFLRKGAHLAIIFITDTEDIRSSYKPDTFYKKLIEIKDGDPLKVLAYAALIPAGLSNPSCARDGEGKPYAIENFLKQVAEAQGQEEGDNYFNLCDSDYGSKLAVIGQDLTEKVGLFVPLGQYPVLNTIVVTYGTQVIPADIKTGWSYDPARVGLKLSRDIELIEEPGAELNVSFLPATK